MTEGAAKRILLVDDDPNIRRFLTEALRLRGYEVHSFEAAEPALEAFSEHRFDLALLDILLPGTNGLQFCRQIRQRSDSEQLPIVMMTAFYKQADHIREAREQYGATDYLLKPFPLKDLHEKIQQLIGSSQPVDKNERLTIAGDLSETPLPRILHNLYSLRATGLLHIERESVKKVIYIKNGYPIFARSNLVKEFLGQILIRNNILTPDQLEKSLAFAKETGQRHGMALIEMELVTPQQINEVLKNQVTDKLLEIFSWTDGQYRFIQAREFKQGVTSIDLSPANLIHQGLQEYANREQVLALLKPYQDTYLYQAESPLYRFQEIQLSTSSKRLFDQCQGQSTLKELLQRHQLSRHELEPSMAALLTTGILVGKTEPAPAASSKSCEEPEDIRKQREDFLRDYAWMMQQDHFTLLGVNESDNREQIRKAYYNLVKQYHPDRFFEQDMLTDLKEKVNALFQKISDAHETLVDSNRRARYVNEMKGNAPKEQPDINNILLAETAFQKGMVFFKAKKFKDALVFFDQAVEIGPTEAEYLIYQAWSSYKTNTQDRGRAINARQNLTTAIGINSRLSLAHLYLGYISKNEGKEDEAKRRFERTIQLDPNCTEALRELRLMQMRNEKTDKQKNSLLGKMFKK
jgi:CheY-like chemotaxis protein/curved DNA-binding protein CbpA